VYFSSSFLFCNWFCCLSASSVICINCSLFSDNCVLISSIIFPRFSISSCNVVISSCFSSNSSCILSRFSSFISKLFLDCSNSIVFCFISCSIVFIFSSCSSILVFLNSMSFSLSSNSLSSCFRYSSFVVSWFFVKSKFLFLFSISCSNFIIASCCLFNSLFLNSISFSLSSNSVSRFFIEFVFPIRFEFTSDS